MTEDELEAQTEMRRVEFYGTVARSIVVGVVMLTLAALAGCFMQEHFATKRVEIMKHHTMKSFDGTNFWVAPEQGK